LAGRKHIAIFGHSGVGKVTVCEKMGAGGEILTLYQVFNYAGHLVDQWRQNEIRNRSKPTATVGQKQSSFTFINAIIILIITINIS